MFFNIFCCVFVKKQRNSFPWGYGRTKNNSKSVELFNQKRIFQGCQKYIANDNKQKKNNNNLS